MKFLHTADWHLGKTFFERSLLEDQQFFLNQLYEEIERENKNGSPYDALIVSGDIYDRSIPPSEAVTLFSSFITRLNREFPELHLFFISGNHDSAERLSFASRILENQNIHLCTDCSSITEPVVIKDCAVYQLPFLSVNCIKRTDQKEPQLFETPLRSQQELLDEAVKQIAASHKKKHPHKKMILNAHLFVTGAKPNSTADGTACFANVGTADAVSVESLAAFDYTALGHLHSFQKCGGAGCSANAFYSGSPLAYTFGEVNDEKYFVRVDTECGSSSVNACSISAADDAAVRKDGASVCKDDAAVCKDGTTSSVTAKNISAEDGAAVCKAAASSVTAEKIPVKPLHNCATVNDTFDSLYSTDKYDSLSGSYLQIVCTDSTPVVNPIALLQKKFPYVLSFTYSERKTSSSSRTIEERRKLLSSKDANITQIFSSFLEDLYGKDFVSSAEAQDEILLFEKTAASAVNESDFSSADTASVSKAETASVNRAACAVNENDSPSADTTPVSQHAAVTGGRK